VTYKSVIILILVFALASCAGTGKTTKTESPPELSEPMRKAPRAAPGAKGQAFALQEPELSAGVLARLAAAEKAAAEKAAAEKAAAEKAAAEKAAAEKAAAEKAAAEKAAAEKAAAEKAAAEKAAAEKAAAEKAAAEKAAAEKAAAAKAAQDKAASAKAAQDKAAAGKSAPAPSTPNIKTPPPSQAIVVDPSAEKLPDISRTVEVSAGSRFDISFDGSGWTYLGERTDKDGVRYEGRRFEGSSILFSLSAMKEGEYVLRFQRQDALRGISYEEHIGVKVSPRSSTQSVSAGAKSGASSGGSTGTSAASASVSSPSSSTGAAQSGAGGSGTVSAATGSSGTTQSAATSASIPDTADGMILYAREQLAAGKPQAAIEALDRFFARFPAGMDEAFYLYALALEQSGPLKDIKRALSFYKIVRDEYPESSFWDKANARISYIERHYFDIR